VVLLFQQPVLSIYSPVTQTLRAAFCQASYIDLSAR
jgi:hypothetical protein